MQRRWQGQANRGSKGAGSAQRNRLHPLPPHSLRLRTISSNATPRSKHVLQRALRKQKKKQNERLVRSTLAASAASVKAEGNSSGGDEDLTVEYVDAGAAVVLCDIIAAFVSVAYTHSAISLQRCVFYHNILVQIRRQRCGHQSIRPKL